MYWIHSVSPSRHDLVGDDVMYVFGGRGVDRRDLGDLTAFKLSSKCFGLFNLMRSSFTHDIQPSDGPLFKA